MLNKSGHYAKKSLWENLPNEKVWSKANQKFNDWFSAIDIDTKGEVFGNFGWHEGGTACVSLKGDELWAIDESSQPKKWVGPFERIGLAFSGDTSYFNRIFGTECYKSEIGENWCFGDGQIIIDSRKYKAAMQLDMSEMPEYGTPVTIDGRNGFWVFVPEKNGWNVFRDNFVTEDGHKEINPTITKPWHQLIKR